MSKASPLRAVLLFPAALLFIRPAHAFCFEEAGAIYGVSPALLQAIAKVESSYRPYAMNRTHANRTASVDIGLMQINSRWIHKGPLKQMGYTQASLLDACTNVKVGAWLLADLIRVHGSMGDGLWEAVGAYNAACTNLKGLDCIRARRVYAWKVYRAMRSMARVSSS